jgi:hypothetical protein
MSEYRYANKSTAELKATLRDLQKQKRSESTVVGAGDIVREMRIITKILQQRGQ